MDSIDSESMEWEVLDYLRINDCITPGQMESALVESQKIGARFDSILVQEYQVPKDIIGKALSQYFGYPYVEYHQGAAIDSTCLLGLNLHFLYRNHWIPYKQDGQHLQILTDNPFDAVKSETIKRIFPDLTLHFSVSLRMDIEHMLLNAMGPEYAKPQKDEELAVEAQYAQLSPKDLMKLRKGGRCLIDCKISVSGDHLDESGEGTALNLSLDGCGFASNLMVPSGVYVQVKLHLPEQASPITIELAIIRWSAGRRFGLEFIRAHPEEQSRLVQAIKSHSQ